MAVGWAAAYAAGLLAIFLAQTALRGVRRGLDALGHRPAKPYGVGIYAEWTQYRTGWLAHR